MCKVTALPHEGKGTDEINDIKNSASPEPSQEHNEPQEGSDPETKSQTKNVEDTDENAKSTQKSLFEDHNKIELDKEEDGRVQGDASHTELDKEADTNTTNKGECTGSGEPYPQDNDCISEENPRDKKENTAEVKDGEKDVSNEKQEEGGDHTEASNTEKSASKTKDDQNQEGGEQSGSLQTETEGNSKGIVTRVAAMGIGIGGAIGSHVSHVTSYLFGKGNEPALK